MAAHRYVLGQVETPGYRGLCEAAITWTLEAGRFSMQAELWMPDKRDIIRGGQCVEDIAALFPNDAKAQRMRAVWQRWHLNDMRAGSPAQEAWLREHPITANYPDSHYDVACKALAAAGLNPDPATGYRYGSAWLSENLPADVEAEIRSWG